MSFTTKVVCATTLIIETVLKKDIYHLLLPLDGKLIDVQAMKGTFITFINYYKRFIIILSLLYCILLKTIKSLYNT